MTAPRLNWGILGTARINDKILPHFAASTENSLYAIGSRDLGKAREAVARFSAEIGYGSYAEVVNDPKVDAIYISLPNHLHAEWAETALRNGKHVLCEKPLTLEPAAAKKLVALAREKGRRLAEGYMYRHHAQSIRVLELVRSGTLGEIRRLQGSFHITIPPGPNIRTNGMLGGGALGDVGCYLVNYANAIFGRAPSSVSAYGRVHGPAPIDDYDTLFSTLLDYGNGLTAQLDGGFLGPRIDEVRILGEKGWLEIPHPFKPTSREVLKLHRRATREAVVESDTIEIQDAGDPYALEFESFARSVKTGAEFPIADWESLAGVETLARIAKAIRTDRTQ